MNGDMRAQRFVLLGAVVLLLLAGLPVGLATTQTETVETHYVYSAGNQLLAEYENGECVKEYIYAGGRLVAEYNPEDGTYLNYTADQIGSTRMVTNQSGDVVYSAAYGPYGDLQRTWNDLEVPKPGFSGKEREPGTGEDYFEARYYDSLSSRFLSPDPVTENGNLYTYTGNNPINYIDPDGRTMKNTSLRDPNKLPPYKKKRKLGMCYAHWPIDESYLYTPGEEKKPYSPFGYGPNIVEGYLQRIANVASAIFNPGAHDGRAIDVIVENTIGTSNEEIATFALGYGITKLCPVVKKLGLHLRDYAWLARAKIRTSGTNPSHLALLGNWEMIKELGRNVPKGLNRGKPFYLDMKIWTPSKNRLFMKATKGNQLWLKPLRANSVYVDLEMKYLWPLE